MVEIDEADRFIFIDAKVENKNLVMTIKDSAGGIEDNILPKIFEPYFTTKHQSQGTGLGLHMTYNLIVNGMHGKIYAKNDTFVYNEKEYTGALFTIEIPLK